MKSKTDYQQLEIDIQDYIDAGLTCRDISRKLRKNDCYIQKIKYKFTPDNQRKLKINGDKRRKQAQNEWNVEYFSIVNY